MKWLLVLFTSISCYAQSWEVFIPIVSQHLSVDKYRDWYDDSLVEWHCTGGYCVEDYPIQNFNPGLILERNSKNNWKYSLGLYRNSLNKLSPIIGIGKEWKGEWGIQVGIAGGYKLSKNTPHEESSFLPIWFIYKKVGPFRISLNQSVVNLGIFLK